MQLDGLEAWKKNKCVIKYECVRGHRLLTVRGKSSILYKDILVKENSMKEGASYFPSPWSISVDGFRVAEVLKVECKNFYRNMKNALNAAEWGVATHLALVQSHSA